MNPDIEIAKKKLYVEKVPTEAVNILEKYKNTDNNDLLELLAFGYFQSKNFKKASLIYKKLDKKYHEGYCELLLGNKDKAKSIWDKAEDNAAVHWARCLISFIDLNILKRPSYLQIRTFLERDLSAVLQAKQMDFAENIMYCGNTLININAETYKLIGKALFNSGFIPLSARYFMKSKDIIDKDPEIYYFLARYYLHIEATREAKDFLYKALELNRDYWPAKKFLQNFHT
jgi:tetratricopeptide (TPR) repeat protein